jgi:hypothetical protein
MRGAVTGDFRGWQARLNKFVAKLAVLPASFLIRSFSLV